MQYKKYANPFAGKAKLLAVISIVLIITISYSIFFYLENTTEQNVRNSIFEQQLQNQLKDTEALSRHIGTDLNLVVDNLHGLANSVYLQQGDLSSNKIKKLAEETYVRLSNNNKIIDRLVITDQKGFETIGLAAKGQQSFAGTNIASRPWVKETIASKTFTFSNGFVGLDGNYRIAVGYPVTNLENGQYMGLIGALLPFESFLSQYGNVHNSNSKYLVAYDKNATVLTTAASKSLIGKNFFGDYVQQFILHNKVLTDFVRNLLSGKPGYAIYDYGNGERLTTGYPIFVNDKPTYFIRIVAPTAEIYSHINDVLFAERAKMFSLIAGTTAAIAILIVFLAKWSSLNERLKIHDKAQQEFINVAAHELRTPIQPIIGLSDILLSKIKDNESRQLVDAIFRNAKRLQRLSQDILDVTKIEGGSLKLNKEHLNLNEVISNVADDYRNQIKNSNRNIKLVYGFNKKQAKEGEEEKEQYQQQKKKNKQLLIQDNNVIIEADKGKIIQVISNLLGNAIKFTKEGTISIITEIEENGHSKEVIVSIKDTGEGIDPEVLPKLFSKFVGKSYQGTGLGLFISKSIIEAHGGRIWAKNNADGKGATFSFTLPH
ncbi:MAG TPA: sensor histidine kinase [Nitrososphaeraceae archaeon]|nr:sensor histidine kinase [Nitrososphaeraceae archaeon]